MIAVTNFSTLRVGTESLLGLHTLSLYLFLSFTFYILAKAVVSKSNKHFIYNCIFAATKIVSAVYIENFIYVWNCSKLITMVNSVIVNS